MTFSQVFARLVALVGAGAVAVRRIQGVPHTVAFGATPEIPAGKPQGKIPTLKMPTARGWIDDHVPTAAPGLKVNAFARGLDHPRWIHVLPNGDVLVAESSNVPGPVKSLFGYAMRSTLERARAITPSANRITLLRDADGDGVAEVRETFLGGLNQPFGMALKGSTFYVGNTDGVMTYPYADGAPRIDAPGTRLATFKPGGHWTRSLLFNADQTKLYAGVGSASNIGEGGLAAEQGRA
ncbi:MAG: sorbosone dehydrogenase family protein, partial [Alphaproteobacteria bacterium]|nr:sorbosone dehydrogenase family protein [Alphaproteobacteria bacterium]